MNKIPFDIKYSPEIEAGKYLVVFNDKPARIICWDKKHIMDSATIIALIDDGESEHTEYFYEDGSSICAISPALYLVPAEPELSEFEVKLWEIMKAEGSAVGPREKFTNDDKRAFHEYSAELLVLARNEIVKSGYAIIEGEHYLEEGRKNYERGKSEALKDLPRWKKCEDGNTDRLDLEALCWEAGSPIEIAFRANGYRIFLSDLEKLPKEE